MQCRPHLSVPYCLWSVKLSEEDLGKLLRLIVLQVADHGFWQHVTEDTSDHYV